jgi:hypothetical protein
MISVSKRQRFGNRYISRRKDGTFSKNVNVGRSISADRRTKAKKTVKAGYGDKGDVKRAEDRHPKLSAKAKSAYVFPKRQAYPIGDLKHGKYALIFSTWPENKKDAAKVREVVFKRYPQLRKWFMDGKYEKKEAEEFGAESKFDKLSNEIAKEYEKKGKSKEEADKIGNATAYKIGVAKYGKRGMERKARAGGIGRISDAEEFGAEECFDCGCVYEEMMEGAMCESCGHTTCIDCSQNINTTDANYKNWRCYEGYGCNKGAEEFGAEPCTCNDMFGSLCPQCNYDSDREGGVCPKGCTVDLAGSVRPQEMEIYTECKIHGQKLGAESFGADMSDCPDCGGNMGGGGCYGCGYGMESQAWLQLFGAESKLPAWPSEAKKAFSQEERDEYDEDRVGPIYEINGEWTWCNTGSGRAGHLELGDSPLCGYCGTNYASESFGADYTTVQRPHHVARVRNDRIGGGKHGLEQWNQPTMHTDQNKLGKMYDEEKGGWVQMDDKARSMFEEIGGKISDFDVVGTAQDVVGKTGLKIPTGIASLAVVWIAYMTGKRYGN